MQLVDEENRVLGPPNLVHDGLDSLFELPAVLGAGHHHRQIQYDDSPVPQELRNIAVDDHLGKALDDRSLANPGFSQQHRIVLGAPRENLNHTLNFIVAADDRVQLGLSRQVGQIAPKESKAGVLDLFPFDVAPRSLSPPASIP